MNWTQLSTFLWLRWRLTMNQGKRLSRLNVILDRVLKVLGLLLAGASLAGGYALGRYVLAAAPPALVTLVWTAAVIAFLFALLVSLMTELQRSEMLTLDRFLHLPVSPSGAFMINYVGSSLTLSLLLFLPGMIGLAAGLTVSRGAAMWPLLLLVPGFFLMMTALMFQLRGWLASMMTNRRRRQTILVAVTAIFIVLVMSPHYLQRISGSSAAAAQPPTDVAAAVDTDDTHEAVRGGTARNDTDVAATRERMERVMAHVPLIIAVAPPGWLAHGAGRVMNGQWLAALPPLLGMGLIGLWSLMRSYRTTLRLYRGEFSGGSGRRQTSPVPASPRSMFGSALARPSLIEKRLPLISEHASAIAVAGFRSLLRSPELKMMLLTPVIMVIVFSGLILSSAAEVSEYGRALRAMIITMAIVLFSLLGFLANQFAYDRDGFRALVLSPASRRDILLGKNLSFMPLALAFMLLSVLAYQWFNPLRVDHLAAVIVQSLSIYALLCMMGNVLSIRLPIAIRPTNGMPIPGQGAKMFAQVLMLLISMLPLSLLLVPLGIEYALYALGGRGPYPVFLTLSVVQTALLLWLYRTFLETQGMLLHRREQTVLGVVTQRAD